MSGPFRVGDLIQRNMVAGLWECPATAVVVCVKPPIDGIKPYELFIVRHAHDSWDKQSIIPSGGRHYDLVKLPGDDR